MTPPSKMPPRDATGCLLTNAPAMTRAQHEMAELRQRVSWNAECLLKGTYDYRQDYIPRRAANAGDPELEDLYQKQEILRIWITLTQDPGSSREDLGLALLDTRRMFSELIFSERKASREAKHASMPADPSGPKSRFVRQSRSPPANTKSVDTDIEPGNGQPRIEQTSPYRDQTTNQPQRVLRPHTRKNYALLLEKSDDEEDETLSSKSTRNNFTATFHDGDGSSVASLTNPERGGSGTVNGRPMEIHASGNSMHSDPAEPLTELHGDKSDDPEDELRPVRRRRARLNHTNKHNELPEGSSHDSEDDLPLRKRRRRQVAMSQSKDRYNDAIDALKNDNYPSHNGRDSDFDIARQDSASPGSFEVQKLGRSREGIEPIPWVPLATPTDALYKAKFTGRWWSWRSYAKYARSKKIDRRQERLWNNKQSHVARIIETSLGQKLEGDDRCDSCRRRGWECWRYNPDLVQGQVQSPGITCAGCRLQGCACSLMPCELDGPRVVKTRKRVRKAPMKKKVATRKKKRIPKPPPVHHSPSSAAGTAQHGDAQSQSGRVMSPGEVVKPKRSNIVILKIDRDKFSRLINVPADSNCLESREENIQVARPNQLDTLSLKPPSLHILSPSIIDLEAESAETNTTTGSLHVQVKTPTLLAEPAALTLRSTHGSPAIPTSIPPASASPSSRAKVSTSNRQSIVTQDRFLTPTTTTASAPRTLRRPSFYIDLTESADREEDDKEEEALVHALRAKELEAERVNIEIAQHELKGKLAQVRSRNRGNRSGASNNDVQQPRLLFKHEQDAKS